MRFLLVMLAGACVGPDKPSDTGSHGGPGGGAADYCAVDHTDAVTDASVAATDFAFTAADASAAQSGAFAGTYTPLHGPTAPVVLHLDETGPISAVYTKLVSAGGDSGRGELGAPSVSDCPPYYEIDVAGRLQAGTLLDETFTAELDASAVDGGHFSAHVDLPDMKGSIRPTFDITKWDHVVLAIDGRWDGSAWTGSLTWQASNDASGAGGASGSVDTGTGTGTVSVSGQVEGAGGFAVTALGDTGCYCIGDSGDSAADTGSTG